MPSLNSSPDSTLGILPDIDLPGALLRYFHPAGLDSDSKLLDHFIRKTPWRQEDISLFGVTRPQPRLIAWYGDPGAVYTYSGISHDPLPWTARLLELRSAIEGLCDMTFNSVLLNYYRDGMDSMGLHADDEPELGDRPVIASYSLGARRRMYFRHKARRELPTQSLDLPHDSLLVMSGTTQEYWKHGIRRTSRPCGPRVNLTFRLVR